MEKHPSGIKPESWLVAAGRAPEPGAPLNVPLIPASNFIIGDGRAYSRNDGTPSWEALEEVVGGLESGSASRRERPDPSAGPVVALRSASDSHLLEQDLIARVRA
jgi:hypothetical protein